MTRSSASRGRRGRVLLVGDAAGDLAAIAPRWSMATSSSDPFDALARVIASTAREPILAAVFDATSLGEDAELVQECFAQVDPSIDLAMWSRPHDPLPTAGDGFLLIRADGEVATLLGEVVKALGLPAEDLPEAPSPAPRSTTVPSIETRSAAPAPAVPPAPEPRVVAAIEVLQTAPPPRVEARAEPLGDVDLVQAVVEGGGRLAELALGIMRQRLRASDVELLPPTTLPGSRRSSMIEVAAGEDRVGWLASATVPASALAPWAPWLAAWMRLDREHAELRRQAMTDELTSVGNRRAFERVLAETLAAARPQRRPVTVMVFDIDNFKTYNDQFGHEAGDEVLRETVHLLRSTIRKGDHVFRIGGDEFVVIFSDPGGPRSAGTSPPDSIEQVVRRFQGQVERLRLPKIGLDAPGTVTISAGLATYPWDGLDPAALLAHADQLALQSKRSGKNRLTLGPGAREHLEGH